MANGKITFGLKECSKCEYNLRCNECVYKGNYERAIKDVVVLTKALDKACKILYEWQVSRTAYFCPKPLYTPMEWKDHFMKKAEEE